MIVLVMHMIQNRLEGLHREKYCLSRSGKFVFNKNEKKRYYIREDNKNESKNYTIEMG